MGTILFVHGTGVRLDSYEKGLASAKRKAAAAGITHEFVACSWGEVLGSTFTGRSLPDPDAMNIEAEADLSQWGWRFADPLFELHQLTQRDPSMPIETSRPDDEPEWEKTLRRIEAYRPSAELKLLLGGNLDFWDDAWSEVFFDPVVTEAFKASHHELPEVSRALARALVASLHNHAVKESRTGLTYSSRESLVNQLRADWGQMVLGIGAFFARTMSRALTKVLRSKRGAASIAAALPVGDVLLYQAKGGAIGDFIREKIIASEPPVTIVAHSLGGIACVDLLAEANPPVVKNLVTVGSQAPLLCELGALRSMKLGDPLPTGFPRWVNFFDRNDFLSYVGHRIWKDVKDVEIRSGLPFPESHSAYFDDEGLWREVRTLTT